MDGDASDLSFLDARVRREIVLLRQDPRLAVATGTRGVALHQHVCDLIAGVEHRLMGAPPPGSSAIATKAFARTLRQAIVELQSAHRALPWLAATREPHLSLGSLYLTEEFARDLIGRNVDLVVVPDNEYMYSTTSWPFRRYIGAIPGFVPTNMRRPIVLNFPLTDADRVLLHPIFAHELGHSSVDEHDLATAVITRMAAEADFVTRRAAAVADVQATMPAVSASDIEQRVDEMLVDWSIEIMCDALAVEVCGLAFVLSWAAFVMALGYGEPGSEHPPNTVRMRLALEHLRARGWDGYLSAMSPTLRAWFDVIAGDATLPLEEPSSFLRDTILSHAEDFRELAAARVGTAAVEAGGSEDAARRTEELLALDILPVEYDGRLDRRGILTGGWHRAIEKHGDAPAGLVGAIADDRLQDLIGKALELSTVVEAWESL